MAKLTSCNFVIPTNIPYCDVRPTIEGESWEDVKEMAVHIADDIGNKQFVERMNPDKIRTKSGQNPDNLKAIKQGNTTVYFDEREHKYYDKDGNQYQSGSQVAESYFVPFNAELVAKGDSKKIEGWDSKGETSMLLGTTVHKAIETKIKYDEDPNHPFLKEVVVNAMELLGDKVVYPEHFVVCESLKGCGIIDLLIVEDEGNKEVSLLDWKVYSDYKKRAALTDEGKNKFPDLKQQVISKAFIQLNFYRELLECNGYKVKDMFVAVNSGTEWEKIKSPMLKVKE